FRTGSSTCVTLKCKDIFFVTIIGRYSSSSPFEGAADSDEMQVPGSRRAHALADASRHRRRSAPDGPRGRDRLAASLGRRYEEDEGRRTDGWMCRLRPTSA